MYEARLIVNGTAVNAQNDATFARVCASNEGIATTAAAASVQDARSAANSAAAAFPGWSACANDTRAGILSAAADIIEARTAEFVAVMAAETGATESWSRFNCSIAAKMFRHAALHTGFERRIERKGVDADVTSVLIRQPVGVVLGIAPWNAPVVLATRSVAMPLACGNTIVLKASERCPKTHAMVIEALCDAGAPEGVANLVTSAPEQAGEITEALVSHAAVRRVNFTGSTRIGRQIAETCARHLKPVVLELSGKDPLVVLADADLRESVKAAAFGAFFNQGQICLSTDKIIVDQTIADEFTSLLAEKAATLKAGDPQAEDAHLGPMISADAAIRVRNLVEDAVSKGARLMTGGTVYKSVMEPTVLDLVDSSMRIYSEESFGPVASIIRTSSEEEAITIANDTEYGLAAAVFSRDVDRAMRVAEQLECGVCQINGATVYDDPNMPFGGMKASGYGKLGGIESIDEFTELRWIAVHRRPGDYFI